MKRIAFWVALVHGVGLGAAVLMLRHPAKEPPKQISIRLQLQPSAPQSAPQKPNSTSTPTQQSVAPPARRTETETRPVREPANTASMSVAEPSSAPTQPRASASATVANSEEQLLSIEATCAGNPKPKYSEITKRLGEQGVSMLRVQVGPDGRISDVQLAKTSGHSRLDRIAMETVREWRCEPPKKGGRAISAWYDLRVEFRLDN